MNGTLEADKHPPPKINPFNPTLFKYDSSRAYAWHAFGQVTVATVTWNRLEFTKKFVSSVLRYSQIPYRFLVIDNGSTDGTVDFLRALAADQPHVQVIENPTNRGLLRAMQQVRDLVDDGLLVFCDNDMEILSNYWLVLVVKAFHAARLARGNCDVALGLRSVNLEEYGFRYCLKHEVWRIPGDRNDEPRTTYATFTKETVDPVLRLEEQIVIGWTEFLMGNAYAMPAAIFRKVPLEEFYPLYVGSNDGLVSRALMQLGVPLGYIDNGPILRHNDWPYTEEKLKLYEKLTKTRAVTDWDYIRWKLKSMFLGRDSR